MTPGFDGTTITRAVSRDRFTVIHNRTIEDDRLSFRALGLLVFVLSKPDNWKTHVNHLATTHSEGREAVRSALTELEGFGYVERKWMRAEGEATPSMHYLVSELPACPEIGNPENRVPRIRDAQKPATSKEGSKEVVSTDSQQTLTIDYFAAFWKVYPRKASKGDARKAWPKALKAVGGDADRIVQGAYRYRHDPNRLDEYTKHPGPWLNAEGWDDDPLPPRSTNGYARPTKLQSTFDTIDAVFAEIARGSDEG